MNIAVKLNILPTPKISLPDNKSSPIGELFFVGLTMIIITACYHVP
jgi:hypothetical protein